MRGYNYINKGRQSKYILISIVLSNGNFCSFDQIAEKKVPKLQYLTNNFLVECRLRWTCWPFDGSISSSSNNWARDHVWGGGGAKSLVCFSNQLLNYPLSFTEIIFNNRTRKHSNRMHILMSLSLIHLFLDPWWCLPRAWKPRLIPSLAWSINYLCLIPQIQLWWNTCWPLGSSHGNWSPLLTYFSNIEIVPRCAEDRRCNRLSFRGLAKDP